MHDSSLLAAAAGWLPLGSAVNMHGGARHGCISMWDMGSIDTLEAKGDLIFAAPNIMVQSVKLCKGAA